VKAGLRNARAKGKRLGRPKRAVDTRRIAVLRAQGIGWKRIAAVIPVVSVRRAMLPRGLERVSALRR